MTISERCVSPRLLDLFCGAGGCSEGYRRAGFDVVGVDVKPQPNYPFEFHQFDALDVLSRLIAGETLEDCALGWIMLDFDAIHASPPCQAHTALSVMWNAREHPNLIPATRELLKATGLLYVIENVVGARPELDHPVEICGAALGLGTATHQLARHRLFESNVPIMVPPCAHGQKPTLGIYGDHARDRRRARSAENDHFRAAEGLAMGRKAMGCDWMNWRELSQAIPPAYTEHIGHYLAAEIRRLANVA